MADMTLDMVSISDSFGYAVLEVDVDDTSNPDDWTVMRARLINDRTRPVIVDVRRSSGQAIFTATIPPGGSPEVTVRGNRTLSGVDLSLST